MRIIALINDPSVIRRILEHLGCWAPEASGPDDEAVNERAARSFANRLSITMTALGAAEGTSGPPDCSSHDLI